MSAHALPHAQPHAHWRVVALALLVAGPLLFATSSTAQERAHFGFAAGTAPVVAAPAGSSNPSGLLVHGLLTYRLPGVRLEPRLDMFYSRRRLAPAPRLGFDYGIEEAWSALAELQWNLVSSGQVRPYLVAGAGTGDSDRTRFTYAAGAGARLRLGVISAFAEAQYLHAVKRDTRDIYGDLQRDDFPRRISVPISFGLVL